MKVVQENMSMKAHSLMLIDIGLKGIKEEVIEVSDTAIVVGTEMTSAQQKEADKFLASKSFKLEFENGCKKAIKSYGR
jgi:tRNA A-37 threonylcarbamoyl transferase component Bud32